MQKTGRHYSKNPRCIPTFVRLTPAEHLEARRLALLEGTSISEILRRGIASPVSVSTLDCNTTRRTA